DDRACVGENYGGGFGYHGRCCPEFSCMKAAADGTCPATHDNAILKLPGYPPGSGTCSCEPAEGPFAYNPDNTAVIAEGACCYVIHSIGCDGRPLRQEDSLIVAAVVVRRDWMAA
ncbi:MAG TPA: hypothetical protein VN764_19330, partial [Polyangiaceae bacterium]|nr:hypothetical protein [Polyangiaceae bacterium]